MAIKAHKDDKEELVRLRKIAEAAVVCLKASNWAGLADEEINLESALKEGGYLK